MEALGKSVVTVVVGVVVVIVVISIAVYFDTFTYVPRSPPLSSAHLLFSHLPNTAAMGAIVGAPMLSASSLVSTQDSPFVVTPNFQKQKSKALSSAVLSNSSETRKSEEQIDKDWENLRKAVQTNNTGVCVHECRLFVVASNVVEAKL